MLTIGLPIDDDGQDGPPSLEQQELDPLAEAPRRAADVAKALARFGYRPSSAGGDAPSSAEAGDGDPSGRIRAAITMPDDDTAVLVVHLVAHGRIAASGERTLHAVGRDGRNLDDPVVAWISLIESHPDKVRPLTLFILDLCHSGVAAELPWHHQMRTLERRAWVIAASGARDRAFGYRLSRATTAVLNEYRDGLLRADPSRRYIPLPTVVREIKRKVARLNAEEGLSQELAGSHVPFFDTLDHLPFFPNPEYRVGAGLSAELDEDLVPLADEALDPLHFMKRGAGAEALDRGLAQGYFRGRGKEAAELTEWFDGAGPRFGVVTGKPGVGKSALLGVMVCAAHPALRTGTQHLWLPLPHRPAVNSRLAVVHARRRNLEEIADSLARQLGARPDDRPTGGWDAEGLARLAGTDPKEPATLVLDALDEAERPADVVRALLVPLAQEATRGNGVRLLIGTRPEPPFGVLLDIAMRDGLLIDLNAADRDDLRTGLEAYVRDLLASGGGPYERKENAAAARELAAGIAAQLVGSPGEAGPADEQPLEWGEFLVAGLYLRHLLTLPVESDPARARQLGLATPRKLTELLHLDLAGPGDRPWMRPVLAALAHAEGLGMPERVLAHAAVAFAPQNVAVGPQAAGSEPLRPALVREALDDARFYLRRDVDVDGTTLYRLFHESLAERLRADPHGLGRGDGA
ncbi:AAA family ATPase [Streptomyces sp. NPDC002520]